MSPRSADSRRAALSRGYAAERSVADHLRAQGWRVLHHNWSTRGGELDLVVQRGEQLRFVEVKARQPSDPTGFEALTYAKQRRLIRAAEAYMLEHPVPDEVAFMVAVVQLGAGHIELIDNAFDA